MGSSGRGRALSPPAAGDANAAPPPRQPVVRDYARLPEPVSLDKGEEMGRFKLGSTVILLFPEGAVDWHRNYEADTATVLGQPLAAPPATSSK